MIFSVNLNLILCADHFYVFAKREPRGTAGKHRFTRAELAGAGFDGVRDALSPGAADGVVELASSKSGIKLVFGTNRASSSFLLIRTC